MKKLYTILLAAGLVSATASAATPSLLMSRPECTRVAKAMAKSHASRAGETTEWTEWQSAGTGTLTMSEDFALFTGMDEWQGDFAGKTVDVRHATDNDHVLQYRFNSVFNDANIVVDVDLDKGTLKLKPQETNIVDLFFELPLIVADFATCYETISSAENLGMDEESFQEVIDAYAAYNYYIPELQRFYIYTGYFHEGDDDVSALCDLTFQMDGATDYTPSLKPTSLFFNETKAPKIDVTFPDETSYLSYTVLPGQYTSKKLQTLINGEGTRLDKSGAVDIASPANGLNTFIAITYGTESGYALETAHVEFTYSPDEADQWKSLGMTDITTDILEIINDEQPRSYKVELQQNIDNDSLYRIVNAHGAAYPGNESEADYDTSVNHYLVFDVSNPEDVKLTPAHVEKNLTAPVFVMGTAEMLTEAGKNETTVRTYRGKFADGAITFPNEGLTLGCSNWTLFQDDLPAEGFVNTNLSGEFKITIPSTQGIADAVATDNASAEYYSLQGIRVAAPAAGTVVIERRGSTVRKVFVK